ncbi:hypothetical protein DGG96_02495 [Legionella qingyii]|uniref:Uncharacterized protein n=1 Tax=Legionella qingyii TaxID=2184757 RepID=A0A317U6S7_9GAMM|nr:hypothetical protein [Legionella qingyii]PWY56444.1 hypothetical protein DGG96_06695 [Legionella qingyii]PWY57199.1 hypothetical protein DGG96_02495 [Legionella qingyii]RUR24962.1 hypothetical protein ELY20_04185 [Legionella qingyii]
MDPNDDAVNYHGSNLAKKYNEKIGKFTEQPSKDLLKEETRITCFGHASQKQFGEQLLSPEAFAENLIKHGLSKDKEVTIDLIGCEIGFLQNNQNYATKVAKYLYEKNYLNITIKAVNDLAIKEKASGMKLLPNFDKSITVRYLPARQKNAYDAEMKKATDPIERRINDIRTELKQLQTQTAGANSMELEKRIGSLRSELYKLMINRTNIETHINDKYYQDSSRYPDIRVALDSNQNYCITPNSFKLEESLSAARKQALIIVNNRIAELEIEKHSVKDSWVPDFILGIETKDKKLSDLYSLRDEVLKPDSTLKNSVVALLTNEVCATKRTKAALLELKGICDQNDEFQAESPKLK